MKIMLIDCANIGHAVFHGLGELDYHGRQTGVIFGFLNKVLQLARTHETNQFVFCWDSQRSIRRTMYPAYKKHRDGPDDYTTSENIDYLALHAQLDELRQYLLYKLGFSNSIMYTGLEADDVIALVIKNGVIDPAWLTYSVPEYLIVSTDKDMFQLLAPKVGMVRKKGEVYTQTLFMKEYDMWPWRWPMVKAIGGCVSDNVEGIEGVADPAKSKTSYALKYFNSGLKPDGKLVKRIESAKGRAIYDRNIALISLPLKDRLIPKIKADHLSRDTFVTIFDELGFTSFLKPAKLQQWEEAFALI